MRDGESEADLVAEMLASPHFSAARLSALVADMAAGKKTDLEQAERIGRARDATLAPEVRLAAWREVFFTKAGPAKAARSLATKAVTDRHPDFVEQAALETERLERLAVAYKLSRQPGSRAGTHHQVTKKEFCRLVKTCELLTPEQVAAAAPPSVIRRRDGRQQHVHDARRHQQRHGTEDSFRQKIPSERVVGEIPLENPVPKQEGVDAQGQHKDCGDGRDGSQ